MSATVNAEIALVHYLRGKYRGYKFLRPVNSATEAVTVTLGFELTSATVNEDDGFATVTGYRFMTWKDYNMTWDPSKFGGVTQVQLPTSEFYMPDITLQANGSGSECTDVLAVANHEGVIIYVPLCEYKLQAAEVSAGHFRVRVGFGSWAFDSTQVNLALSDTKGITMTDFTQGRKWEVSNGGAEIKTRDYTFDGKTHHYPCANFYVDIKRKASK